MTLIKEELLQDSSGTGFIQESVCSDSSVITTSTCMAGGMSGSFIRIKRSARHTACGTMIPKE